MRTTLLILLLFSAHLVINANPILNIELGADTSLCANDTLILDLNLNAPVDSIFWSTGETSEFIQITTSGIYFVEVIQDSCIARDTILVDFIPIPEFDLGNDTTICAYDSIRLSYNSSVPITDFLWSTGDTSSTITIYESGLYTLSANNEFCTYEDSISINTITMPIIDPGIDSTYFCEGEFIDIGIDMPSDTNIHILWNTGDSVSIITPEEEGLYIISITNAFCNLSDSIYLEEIVINDFDLGLPPLLCLGDTVLIGIDSSYSEYDILWNTNPEDTTSVINVTESGLYIINVSRLTCIESDSINIETTPYPDVIIGIEENCYGLATVFYNLSENVLSEAVQTWTLGDGEMFQSDTSNFEHFYDLNGGIYNISLSIDNNGCESSLDTTISVHLQPTASASALPSCFGDLTQINNDSEAVDNSATVQILTDGLVFDESLEEMYSHIYSESGSFDVTFIVNNNNGCIDTFQFTTLIHPLPVVSFQGLDSSYCENEGLDLLIGFPPNGTFTSNQGHIIENPNIEDNISFFDPVGEGENIIITYTHTNANTCSNSYSQTVNNVYPAPMPVIHGLSDAYCEDVEFDTIYTDYTGGVYYEYPYIIDESTNDSTAILEIKEAGTFSIAFQYTNEFGCMDSVKTEFTVNPLPVANLGPDQYIMPGDIVTISNEINLNDYNYLWSTGSDESSIQTSNAGYYIITVTNNNTGCAAQDTILIEFGDPPTNILPLKSTEEHISVVNPIRNDQITIKFLNAELSNKSIQLYTIDSKEVLSENIPINSTEEQVIHITIPHYLPSGIYILKVEDKVVQLLKL